MRPPRRTLWACRLAVCVLAAFWILLWRASPGPPQLPTVSGDHHRPNNSAAPVTKVDFFSQIDPGAFTNSHFFKSVGAHLQPETLRIAEMTYPAFNVTSPRFISPEDEHVFWTNSDNRKYSGVHSYSGVIAFIREGLVSPDTDCGAYSSLSDFRGKPPKTAHFVDDVICPLLVPDGGYFQHFIDGILPKLMQIHDLLSVFRFKILLPKIHHKIIYEILDQLNISRDRIIFYEDNWKSVFSSIQINTCVTPPVHPVLWQRGRAMMTSAGVRRAGSYVILLSRGRKTRNRGRRILNEPEIIKMLSVRYGPNFRVFTGGYNFSRSRELFGRARVVIGVHGGAFYNINLSPPGLRVVEYMPTQPDGDTPRGLAHTVVWRMAVALDQQYWRVPVTPSTRGNDIHVSVRTLRRILDTV